MTSFRITNTISGHDFGCFDADTISGALDAMARDAGHSDYAEACRAVPVAKGEIKVSFDRDSVDNAQLRALSREAATAGDLETVADVRRAIEDGDEEAAERCIDTIEYAAMRASED